MGEYIIENDDYLLNHWVLKSSGIPKFLNITIEKDIETILPLYEIIPIDLVYHYHLPSIPEEDKELIPQKITDISKKIYYMLKISPPISYLQDRMYRYLKMLLYSHMGGEESDFEKILFMHQNDEVFDEQAMKNDWMCWVYYSLFMWWKKLLSSDLSCKAYIRNSISNLKKYGFDIQNITDKKILPVIVFYYISYATEQLFDYKQGKLTRKDLLDVGYFRKITEMLDRSLHYDLTYFLEFLQYLIEKNNKN